MIEFTEPASIEQIPADPSAPPFVLTFHRQDDGSWRPEMDLRMDRQEATILLLAVAAQLTSIMGLGPLPDGPPHPMALATASTAITTAKLPQLLHAVSVYLSSI